MSSYLCLSVIFLAREYHGRRQGIEGEWPPAPLRFFQALVASAAAHWRNGAWNTYARPALEWLENQPPPRIFAPRVHLGVPYRLAVPNNDLDVVAAAWARRQVPRKQPADLKAFKTVRTYYFLEEKDQVLYLWPLPEPCTEEVRQHIEVLKSAARNLVALGWGQDLVAGNGRSLSTEEYEELLQDPQWELWQPTADARDGSLRVPQSGTLHALTERYQDFLRRLQSRGLNYLDPLDAYAAINYRREIDPPGVPWRLLKSGARSSNSMNCQPVAAGCAPSIACVRLPWSLTWCAMSWQRLPPARSLPGAIPLCWATAMGLRVRPPPIADAPICPSRRWNDAAPKRRPVMWA